ncbi:MAG: hypothetical protein QOD29_2022, partial [Alphaproteobacteria bacterium]|nr:hypothetical protein [Alphaproteobacteria bacterium]
VSVTNERSGASLTIKHRRTTLGARQCHQETRSRLRSRYGSREPNTGDKRYSD